MRHENLFQPGEAPDPAYCNLRDADHCRKWKSFCERLWVRFEPYADSNFLSQIRIHFHQRFWEMYLTVTFLERGYTLHKHKNGGPEFGIDVDGKRYWFDAIAPTAGTGPDAVPELQVGRSAASPVPQKEIILRITSALDAKRMKWKKDLAKGRVAESEGYIIAINDSAIRSALFNTEMPHVVRALYGIGDLTVAFDRRTFEVTEAKYQHRATIPKKNQVAISSQWFAAGECPEVSAILYSGMNAARLGTLGEDFMILHNNQPNIPLPRAALKFYREYWVDGDQLVWQDWPGA
ncbi:MAG TPA: hypothetical protein VEG60_10570 [Candidatus Binatia bacterium]|nr:hypothetical protein [Candidatus Binatia bacterium]